MIPIKKVETYINCDLRYFNLEDIVQNLGFFDGFPSSIILVLTHFPHSHIIGPSVENQRSLTTKLVVYVLK